MSSSNPNDPESTFSVPEQHDTSAVADGEIGAGSFAIVGIGASAGGLEAYQQLLTHLPDHTGMAFVLIQHLEPHHESQMVEILARSTQMPVSETVHGAAVKPNHVYIITPNVNLAISQGRLQMTPREEGRRPHLPIDYFFRALAEDQKTCAVGIVLSGTGSDGTQGLCEIKALGGITLAQEETSAKYSGMPRSAAASGCADLILTPDEIARRLAELGDHPYLIPQQLSLTLQQPTESDAAITEIQFRKTLARLRGITGVDFTQYREAMIKRRIMRRMALNAHQSLTQYVQKLASDDLEVKSLYHDLLINVTSFFRDGGVFESLKQQIYPQIMKGKGPRAPVRIWVAGCSTGQEAYSLAISLVEFFDDKPSAPPVQIFATDVSDPISLDKARIGIYPDTIEAEVSPERLRRFFQKEDHIYRVDKSIRDMCVFARQNLIADPPFSHVDLITCRNVLIYLGTPLQRHVLPTFHYALNMPGFLVLGSAETVGENADLFELTDRTNKIYAKKATAGRMQTHRSADNSRSVSELTFRRVTELEPAPADYQREADRLLLGRFAPPGVLVGENFDIIQFRGRTSAYLEQPPGEPTNNLLKMAREGLLMELRKAIEEVRRDHKPVRCEGVQVYSEGAARSVNFEALPIKPPGMNATCVLILFDGARASAADDEATSDAPALASTANAEDNAAAQLQRELTATKEYLQSLLQQHDANNEELRSANEEIMSNNEELQSTNEELETAKEELQSTNEELITVNDQLQNRNVELNDLNDDMLNFLTSTGLAVVMVGSDLCIRRYTQAARGVINLLANDIGRPLSDIKTNIDIPDLDSLIQEVIDEVQVREREVQDGAGRWFTVRIHPYRTADRKIDGAVIVLIDISAIKAAEQTVHENEERLRLALQGGALGTWYFDVKNDRVYWDEYTQKLLGLPEHDERNGEGFLNALHPQDRDKLRAAWTLEDGEFTEELRFLRPDHSITWLLTTAKALIDETGARRIAGVCVDINVQKKLEAALEQRVEDFKQADRQKNEFLAMLSHELRNPLAPISNAAELLKRAIPPGAELHGSRDIIEHGVTQMTRLLEDLLDTSRLTHHSLDLRREPVELSAIIAGAVETSQPQIDAKNHRLELSLPADNLWLHADRARLVQLFSNLLNNASKYTGKGGHIRIVAKREDDHVEVLVQDDGIGMSQELLSRAFEMFSRGERNESGGLGIGLALVKSLVEMHGGSVEGRSEGTNRGSEFIVRLPLMAQAPPDEEPKPEVKTGAGQARKKLLVVDDNKMQATSLCLLLEFSGHEVKTAADGPSALALLADFVPDFALIDLGLPRGMSGHDVARQIRAQPRLNKTILIAQTGWGREEDREQSSAAGFDYHLVKPIDHDRLQRIIDGEEKK